jgi:DNA repair protein RecO (recombination protein O)
MPTYRDQAIVLRAYRLGEADRIVTLLTRSNGKVRAVARGVRRTSSRIGGRLEPFNYVDVQFARGRTLDVVAQVESLQQYGDPLSTSYQRFTAGEAMVETADRLVAEEGSPAPAQFRLLLGALHALSLGTKDGVRPAPMILDSYLLRALAMAGYAPVLDGCARCGARGRHAWFNPSAGGMVCHDCRAGATARPSQGAWDLLAELLTGDWTATRDVDATTQREVSGLVAAFVNWHLEHALRSLPLVDRSAEKTTTSGSSTAAT